MDNYPGFIAQMTNGDLQKEIEKQFDREAQALREAAEARKCIQSVKAEFNRRDNLSRPPR